MTQGMIISLEILAIIWAIADLSQAMPVKEQRVDGYSVFTNTVRCTLVAGKPVLGRKYLYSSSKFKFCSALLHYSTTTGKSLDITANSKKFILINSLDP